MNKEFVSYELAVKLKELGFDEPCLGFYDGKGDTTLYFNNLRNGSGDFEPFNNNKRLTWFGAPLYQQAFRWFREKYDLHVQIRKENYFQQSAYEYFHFDISRGRETDITKQEDLLGDIFDECSQDIPGNHLNDEKYSKIVFERKFAFKTYEEIESYCLDKLIEIVK